MTVTPAASRAVNGCLVFMLVACLALWAMRYHFLKLHGNALTQTSHFQEVSTLGGNAKSAPAASEVASEKDVAQAVNDAGLELARDMSRPWIREALRDPKFRTAAIFEIAQHNEPHYFDLYKLLKIDDATSETLRGLLGERFMSTYEAIEDNMARQDAQMADSRSQTQNARMNQDEMIAKLLGPEKYALFKEYEESLPQQNQIKQIRQELEFSQEPLAPEQEAKLSQLIEDFSKDDPFAHMDDAISRLDPAHTVRISEKKLDMLKEALSTEQIAVLAGLQKRQENLRSINYPWKVLGKRMRTSK
jgi:predicted DNA binding CopG/RHH family protein